MKENCVVCNEETPYNRSDHIDMRNYYIEGCGQLCAKCYHDTYESSSNNTYKKQFDES